MAMIYLVRHGEPSGSWHNSKDPGLTEKGHGQAEAVAVRLAEFGGLRLFSSPLLRARETAAPYARNRGLEMSIEPRVAEIPSPTEDLAGRTAWLKGVMQGRYPELGAELNRWRDSVLAALSGITGDTVFFTHYLVINVAVGAALGDDRVVNFRPAHASLTRLELRDGRVHLLERGREAESLIL